VDSQVRNDLAKEWASSEVEADRLWKLSEQLVGQTFRE